MNTNKNYANLFHKIEEKIALRGLPPPYLNILATPLVINSVNFALNALQVTPQGRKYWSILAPVNGRFLESSGYYDGVALSEKTKRGRRVVARAASKFLSLIRRRTFRSSRITPAGNRLDLSG